SRSACSSHLVRAVSSSYRTSVVPSSSHDTLSSRCSASEAAMHAAAQHSVRANTANSTWRTAFIRVVLESPGYVCGWVGGLAGLRGDGGKKTKVHKREKHGRHGSPHTDTPAEQRVTATALGHARRGFRKEHTDTRRKQ
ncbi:uncharacterized protein Tco025E_07452, partial [Trypanosoma conorhini]